MRLVFRPVFCFFESWEGVAGGDTSEEELAEAGEDGAGRPRFGLGLAGVGLAGDLFLRGGMVVCVE
jgi:hypothetical protein